MHDFFQKTLNIDVAKRRGFWAALAIIVTLVLAPVKLLGLDTSGTMATLVLALFWVVPIFYVTALRLKDAGFSRAWALLVPVQLDFGLDPLTLDGSLFSVGPIDVLNILRTAVLLVALMAPSKAPTRPPVPLAA